MNKINITLTTISQSLSAHNVFMEQMNRYIEKALNGHAEIIVLDSCATVPEPIESRFEILDL